MRPRTIYYYEYKKLCRHRVCFDCDSAVICQDGNSTRYRCTRHCINGMNGHDIYGYASIKEAKANEIAETKSVIYQEIVWLEKLMKSTERDQNGQPV